MAQSFEAKRATTGLTIAQFKFKQALRQEDQDARLSAVSVDTSAQFLRDLDAVLEQNTRVNVQTCTEWIVKNVLPSKARTAILGGYFVAVSKSIIAQNRAGVPTKKAARNRLDLLLVINDVLHADKYHNHDAAELAVFSQECGSFISKLVEEAALYATKKDCLIEKKLRALLNFWKVNHLLSAGDIEACRAIATEALHLAQGGVPVEKSFYQLPEYHGERAAPWHELPASYMLEQMIRKPNLPINPSRIKIAKLDKKPVSSYVHGLLDNFFDNLDLKYIPTGDNPTGETPLHKLCLDPMGQIVKTNKMTGEISTVSNGYGWSPKFCQEMQQNGGPENIKKLREDDRFMEAEEEMQEVSRGRRKDERVFESPRRRRASSSDSSLWRGRRGSYDSRRSHSRPGSRHSSSHDRRYSSPRNKRERSGDRTYARDARGSSANWPPPMPYGQDSSNSQQPIAQHAPPRPAHGQGHPFPFHAPPFPHGPPPTGQFSGQLPFAPPPPGQFPGGYIPPPPPNYSGPIPPLPPNMTAALNMPGNFGGQPGNQYTRSAGYGNNNNHGQHQGGHHGHGGRGGRGNSQHSRGGYRGGGQRGQRGGKW